MAILGAKSTFGVHQEVKLNGLAEVSLADFECRVDQIQKLLVARVEDGQSLGLRHIRSIEDFGGQSPPGG